MHKFWHILEHSLIDTLKIAPILLVVYFLIEFLEYKKLMKFESSKMLKGKSSPVFGSLFGSLPQCGFSVISTDLFNKGFISIGALLSVYIATSDEALPILLSNKGSWPSLLAIMGGKILLGIIVGYLAMWLYNKIFKTKNIHFNIQDVHSHNHKDHHEENNHLKHEHSHEHEDNVVKEHIHESYDEGEEHYHEERLDKDHSHSQAINEHIGCCKHDLESDKFDWKHPLFHCIKILLFILIINLIFSAIIELVGEDNLTKFLSNSSALQPLLAVLIGLIPNCASSVVLTELYLLGGLSFGAILAGLSVNAGLGLMVLFKQNKNIKEIIFILSMLIIPSLLTGYVLHFIL